MNQSALIGGALIAGFVLWIARQDRLSTYARVFFGTKPDAHATAPSNSSGNVANIGGGIDFSFPNIGQMEKDLGNVLPSLPSIPGFGH